MTPEEIDVRKYCEEWSKYSDIDPYTCSLSELNNEVERLKNTSELFNSMQLATKLFLNSGYGACGNQFFAMFNLAVATAITLAGRDINHYSEKLIIKYFSPNGPFFQDHELHKKLGLTPEQAQNLSMEKGKFTVIPPRNKIKDFDYLGPDCTESLAVYGDTDSVSGDSKIKMLVDNVILEQNVEDWYRHAVIMNCPEETRENDSKIVDTKSLNMFTPCMNIRTNEIEYKKVKHIYKHKVSKKRYRIKLSDGTHVDVTGDHSIMVRRTRYDISGDKLSSSIESVTAKDIHNIRVYSSIYKSYIQDEIIRVNYNSVDTE